MTKQETFLTLLNKHGQFVKTRDGFTVFVDTSRLQNLSLRAAAWSGRQGYYYGFQHVSKKTTGVEYSYTGPAQRLFDLRRKRSGARQSDRPNPKRQKLGKDFSPSSPGFYEVHDGAAWNPIENLGMDAVVAATDGEGTHDGLTAPEDDVTASLCEWLAEEKTDGTGGGSERLREENVLFLCQ